MTEEGLSGRTTVFSDPLDETMDALTVIYSLLKSHKVINLLIVMLGTNDTKERLGVNAACIAIGMERLVYKTQSVDCWGDHAPNVLIICPPPIRSEMELSECIHTMGKGCVEKSKELPVYYEKTAKLVSAYYLNAEQCELNIIDGLHLTKRGHAQLAKQLSEMVPGLIP